MDCDDEPGTLVKHFKYLKPYKCQAKPDTTDIGRK